MLIFIICVAIMVEPYFKYGAPYRYYSSTSVNCNCKQPWTSENESIVVLKYSCLNHISIQTS